MKMEHITISTACIDASEEFYKNIVGLKVVRRMKNEFTNIVFLAAAEGETCVELIEEKSEPYSGRGLSIGFEVCDVKAAHEELNEKGFEPTDIVSPGPGTEFFFVKDPNGVKIQFIKM